MLLFVWELKTALTYKTAEPPLSTNVLEFFRFLQLWLKQVKIYSCAPTIFLKVICVHSNFRLVFKQVRRLLGGRVRLILSGGAPLSPDTHELIKICICEKVIQGYGLTETCACGTVMDGNYMISFLTVTPLKLSGNILEHRLET